MFTFIVTNYNQKNTILYTLESIKYQIVKYGQGQEFELIIADNCSTDGSKLLIDKWILDNIKLFVRINKIYREKNIGLANNVANAFENINGDNFVLVNGDDMISCYNLFAKAKLLNDYDVIRNATLKFTLDKKIIVDKSCYLDTVLQKFTINKHLHYVTSLGSPFLNGTIFKKDLLSDEVINYIKSFYMLDDRTRFVKILEENPNLSVMYDEKPIFLYRVSENSTSSLSGNSRDSLNKDMIKLFKDQLENCSSITLRISLNLQIQSVKWRGQGKIKNIIRYFTPYFLFLGMLVIFNRKEINKMQKELIEECVDDNKRYLLHIESEVKRYE